MKTIIFKTEEYELASFEHSASRLTATLEDNDYFVDEVIEEATGAETITVKEDGETIGVYSGYTKFLATSVHQDKRICVELINEDIQAQIDAISGEVQEQADAIDTLDKKVDNAVNTLGDKAEAADILLGN